MFSSLFIIGSYISHAYIDSKDLYDRSAESLKVFSQLKDHNSPEAGNFNQSYYETDNSETNWEPGKPVILCIAGESDTFKSCYHDFIKEIALEFNAKVLTLEHRWFGRSYVTPNASTYEDLKSYMNVDQAIEDLYRFGTWWENEYDTTNKSTWILSGGSYSGMLCSFTRRIHSDLFKIGISSSGVVLATDDFPDFDIQDAISLGPECATLARSAVYKITQMLENEEDKNILLQMFDMVGMPKNDMYFVLGEIFTIAHQYGRLHDLCPPIIDASFKNDDIINSLAKFARGTFKEMACGGENCTLTYSSEELKKDKGNKLGPRNWLWMTCNELGYWQTSPGRIGIRPKQLTKEYFQNQCNDVFPGISPLNVSNFNEKWGGYNQKTERMIYITGDQDPWTWVCITEENLIAKNSYAHTIVGPEQGHCPDLRNYVDVPPPDLVRTRNMEKKLIALWLKEIDSEKSIV